MEILMNISDDVVDEIIAVEMQKIIEDTIACPPELIEAAKIILADIMP